MELAASIKVHGLQQPVKVRPKGNNQGYWIVFGERRYRAHVDAGLPTIKAIIEDEPRSHDSILATQLIENMQREDMNPMDTAKGLQALVATGKTPEEIAAMLGYSTQTIERKLSLNLLDKRLQKHVATGQLLESIALLLTKLSVEGQYRALRRIKGRSYAQAKPVVDAILEQEQQVNLFDQPLPKRETKSLVRHYNLAILSITAFVRKITDHEYRILARGLDDGKLNKRIAELEVAMRGLRRVKRQLETYQQGKKLVKKAA